MSCRILVLISGNGSNLQAIIDAVQSGQISGDIVGVVCNVPDAYGLTRAKLANIPVQVIDHRAFATRELFDHALLKAMIEYNADLVVLAGFMRILGNELVSAFNGNMLNIHPSLLPKYPGLKTHQKAIEAGDEMHGATIHFVSPVLDGGALIAQSRCKILPDDTPESLANRVHALEHVLYPTVIAWYSKGRLRFDQGSATLDGQTLTCPVQL